MSKSFKTHIGIDPGKSGAIVKILPSGEIEKELFPFIGDEYDISQMSEIFNKIRFENPHIVIEDIHALQKPFDSANWSLSGCKHIIITLCVVHKIPYTLVHSKLWQKELFQGIPVHKKPAKPDKNGKMREGRLETKIMALLAVKRLFPEENFLATLRSKVPHEGIVDALCMAEYSRRKFD